MAIFGVAICCFFVVVVFFGGGGGGGGGGRAVRGGVGGMEEGSLSKLFFVEGGWGGAIKILGNFWAIVRIGGRTFCRTDSCFYLVLTAPFLQRHWAGIKCSTYAQLAYIKYVGKCSQCIINR